MAGEIELIDYYERPLQTLKGEERIIGWRTNPLKNDQGEIIGLISSGEDITERKRAEAGLETRKYELSERLKELVCLYETSRLLSSKLPLSEIFQNLVYLMQNSWQHSELACVRVQYLHETYQTDNFRETEWTQHSAIHLNGIKIGSLDVFYLEKLPEEDEIILTLYYLNESPVEEICEIIKLTKSNVKVKLHRARKKFYLALEHLLKEELTSIL